MQDLDVLEARYETLCDQLGQLKHQYERTDGESLREAILDVESRGQFDKALYWQAVCRFLGRGGAAFRSHDFIRVAGIENPAGYYALNCMREQGVIEKIDRGLWQLVCVVPDSDYHKTLWRLYDQVEQMVTTRQTLQEQIQGLEREIDALVRLIEQVKSMGVYP